MDIRQLKYFVAVANTRNFTRASEQLHIAQPPLSRQIQLLEEELGVQLILRNSRPLRLTEAGRVFYEQALQILNRLEQLKNATQQIGLNQRQTLSIGFVAPRSMVACRCWCASCASTIRRWTSSCWN
jgi:DNA-binding transcriptional LysR family regulator